MEVITWTYHNDWPHHWAHSAMYQRATSCSARGSSSLRAPVTSNTNEDYDEDVNVHITWKDSGERGPNLVPCLTVSVWLEGWRVQNPVCIWHLRHPRGIIGHHLCGLMCDATWLALGGVILWGIDRIQLEYDTMLFWHFQGIFTFALTE